MKVPFLVVSYKLKEEQSPGYYIICRLKKLANIW